MLMVAQQGLFTFLQDESTCLGGGGTASGGGAGGGGGEALCQQLFVRILASLSTLFAGGIVFVIASGSADAYEVILASTGTVLGTLVAVFIIGKKINAMTKLRPSSSDNQKRETFRPF